MPEAAETPTDYGQTQVEITGFEPPHQESCPIGPIAIVRRKEGQQVVRRTPSRRARSPQGTAPM